MRPHLFDHMYAYRSMVMIPMYCRIKKGFHTKSTSTVLRYLGNENNEVYIHSVIMNTKSKKTKNKSEYKKNTNIIRYKMLLVCSNACTRRLSPRSSRVLQHVYLVNWSWVSQKVWCYTCVAPGSSPTSGPQNMARNKKTNKEKIR